MANLRGLSPLDLPTKRRTYTDTNSVSIHKCENSGSQTSDLRCFFISLSVLFLRFHQWQPFHFRVMQLLLEKIVLCVCENE